MFGWPCFNLQTIIVARLLELVDLTTSFLRSLSSAARRLPRRAERHTRRDRRDGDARVRPSEGQSRAVADVEEGKQWPRIESFASAAINCVARSAGRHLSGLQRASRRQRQQRRQRKSFAAQ